MTNRRNTFIAAIVGVMSLLLVIALFFAFAKHTSPLAPAVAKQVSFISYYPAQPWTSHLQQASYNTSANVLTIVANQGAKRVTLNEQATPDQFNDIPNYYSTLLTKLNKYQTLSTAAGQVYLVHPFELKGKQTAILNTNGTLIFAEPNADFDDSTWRRLFNNLLTIKP
jgi:uncharacterized protein YcnI